MLGDIEQAGDRLEVLRARFATSGEETWPVAQSVGCGVSAEIRLLEDAIGRWIKSLNAHGDPGTAVSRQHREAAPYQVAWRERLKHATTPMRGSRDYLHADLADFVSALRGQGHGSRGRSSSRACTRSVHREQVRPRCAAGGP